LWQQRKRAADLLGVASKYGSFPMLLEAYRECLRDVFDMPSLVETLRRIERREIRTATVDSVNPSPFASALLFGYVANYIYDGDAPLAERRAQALSVDQAQLRELLGEAELRELLDPIALAALESSLQGLDERQRVRSADRLHDLLLRVGDLSRAELAPRIDPAADPEALIEELRRERRAIEVMLAGEPRLVAAEDAGRLRDAFGVPPPRGLPAAFLEPSAHALRDVAARYARTHGPFHAGDVARRYAVAVEPVEQALADLFEAGRVVEGEFRPGGSGREWCDPQVLSLLRQRSLARLRKQVEPADPSALARLLVEWQGVRTSASDSLRGGPDALLDVVEQLQGFAIPASELERDILPARLPGYRPGDLDQLCAAGEVVWVGAGALGERDGRVALYLTDSLPLLHAPRDGAPAGELHDALRAHLARHGASFFAELLAAAGGGLARPVLDALWDLVWAGEITNDTPGALRAFVRPPRTPRRGAATARRAFRSRR